MKHRISEIESLYEDYPEWVLAKKLGVKIRIASESQILQYSWAARLRYTAFSLKSRTVAISEDNWPYKPEVILHEIMHVLTHPPGLGVEDVVENFVLMQTELAYAKTIYDHDSYQLQRVIEWQDNTEVDGVYLGDLTRDSNSWRLGLNIAQEAGLILPDGRPSFEWPRWSLSQLKPNQLLNKWYNDQ